MLIKDLISLPERVQPGDFVMRLSSGVSDDGAAQTLSDYVITPELERNFREALGAIRTRWNRTAVRRATFTAALEAARATLWRSCSCC